MADISDNNSALNTKLVGADATGIEQTPVASTIEGRLKVESKAAMGKNTYSAAVVFSPIATGVTDIFTITGSSTKTIEINRIVISMSTTSGSPVKTSFLLIKRSTANTGGTSTVLVTTPNDSIDPPATATLRSYTTNPLTLGTQIGIVKSHHTGISQSGTNGVVSWEYCNNSYKPLTLRGTSQMFSINLNSGAVAGPICSISIEWAEE